MVRKVLSTEIKTAIQNVCRLSRSVYYSYECRLWLDSGVGLVLSHVIETVVGPSSDRTGTNIDAVLPLSLLSSRITRLVKLSLSAVQSAEICLLPSQIEFVVEPTAVRV